MRKDFPKGVGRTTGKDAARWGRQPGPQIDRQARTNWATGFTGQANATPPLCGPKPTLILDPHRCFAPIPTRTALTTPTVSPPRPQLFAEFQDSVAGRGAGSGPGGGFGAEAGGAASRLTMLDGTVHPACATTLSFLKVGARKEWLWQGLRDGSYRL